MRERDEGQPKEGMSDEERRQHSESPEPGRPAGDTSREEHPSPAEGTPPIGNEDQQRGQTAHPAPEDDVGVGDEGTGE